MAPFKGGLFIAILAINISWVFTATLNEADLAINYPGLYSRGTCPTIQPMADFNVKKVSKVCAKIFLARGVLGAK